MTTYSISRFAKLFTIILWLSSGGFSQGTTVIEPGFTVIEHGATIGRTDDWGGLTTDASGNVYIAAGSKDTIAVFDGVTHSLFGATAPEQLLSTEINGDTLYVGVKNRSAVYKSSITSPGFTLVGNLPFTDLGDDLGILDIAIAPAGFGIFGGQLIIGTESFGLWAMSTTGAVTLISDEESFTSLEFNSVGTLYALRHSEYELATVSPDGIISPVASGFQGDGLAIHPNDDMYVISSISNSILKITPTGVVTTFASDVDANPGWFPQPIGFSPDFNTLWYVEADADLESIVGFIPEPTTATLTTLALIPLAIRRRSRSCTPAS